MMTVLDKSNSDGAGNVWAPANGLKAIVPSDTVDLEVYPRGIYVGVGGDIAAVTARDEVVLLVGVPTGTILPIRLKRINATNTTAASLVALNG